MGQAGHAFNSEVLECSVEGKGLDHVPRCGGIRLVPCSNISSLSNKKLGRLS